jgi:hypothetical protein
MTLNQNKKRSKKQSRKSRKPRKSIKRKSRNSRKSIKRKSRNSRKFRMSNNTINFLQNLVVVTRDIGNLKNNDKNKLSNSINQNVDEVKRTIKRLTQEIEDRTEAELDISTLEKNLGENIIELKWLGFVLNSTDKYIDRLYDHILKDEYISPFFESEPDIESVKNRIIDKKNNLINTFWRNLMALRDTKKEQFLLNIEDEIEEYKNAHSMKKYFENATKHIQGLSQYKIKSKRKSEKNRASPYKVEKSRVRYNNKIRLLNELSLRTPQKSSRKPIEGKRLSARN